VKVGDFYEFEIGDLVKLSPDEEKQLIDDTGCSPEKIYDWKVGIVLDHGDDGDEGAYYKVKWFPSGDIIDEVGRMITHMDKI